METKQTPFQEAIMRAWMDGWYAGRKKAPNDDGKFYMARHLAKQNPAENTAPDLLKACQCEHNDTMDGDLLCIVAEYLRVRADFSDRYCDGLTQPAHADMLRNWASRLETKQRLQREAIALAKAAGK